MTAISKPYPAGQTPAAKEKPMKELTPEEREMMHEKIDKRMMKREAYDKPTYQDCAAPRNTEQLVRPDFGGGAFTDHATILCEREHNTIAYVAEIVAVLGGDENPKLDSMEGWLFRVMTRARELRLLYPASLKASTKANAFVDIPSVGVLRSISPI